MKDRCRTSIRPNSSALFLAVPPSVTSAITAKEVESATDLGQYPIVTPVTGELKTNRTYGLSGYGFYF